MRGLYGPKEYKPQQAKFNIYLRWLINYIIKNSGVLYEPNLYSALQAALSRCTGNGENGHSGTGSGPSYSSGLYAPSHGPTRDLLTSGILYSFACLTLFQDASFTVKEWPASGSGSRGGSKEEEQGSESPSGRWTEEDRIAAHEQVLACMVSHGFEVVDSESRTVAACTLVEDLPFNEDAHSSMLGMFASIFTEGIVKMNTIVQHIKEIDETYPSISASNSAADVLPFDVEDALLMWINKVISVVKETNVELKEPGMEVEIIDDLLKDISDAKPLICLLLFYCPELLPSLSAKTSPQKCYFGINTTGYIGMSKLSATASEQAILNSQRNVELFIRGCCSGDDGGNGAGQVDVYFPFDVEDIVYSNSYIKPVLLAVLGELFVQLGVNQWRKKMGKSGNHGISHAEELQQHQQQHHQVYVPQESGSESKSKASSAHQSTHHPNDAVELSKPSLKAADKIKRKKANDTRKNADSNQAGNSNKANTDSAHPSKASEVEGLRKVLSGLMSRSSSTIAYEREANREEMLRIKAEGYQIYLRDMYKKQQKREIGTRESEVKNEEKVNDDSDKNYSIQNSREMGDSDGGENSEANDDRENYGKHIYYQRNEDSGEVLVTSSNSNVNKQDQDEEEGGNPVSKISIKLSDRPPPGGKNAGSRGSSAGGIKFFVPSGDVEVPQENITEDDYDDQKEEQIRNGVMKEYHQGQKAQLQAKREAEKKKMIQMRKMIKQKEKEEEERKKKLLKSKARSKSKPSLNKQNEDVGSPNKKKSKSTNDLDQTDSVQQTTPKRLPLPKFYTSPHLLNPNSPFFQAKVSMKSNKLLVANSIRHVCLPGPVNQSTREAALRALEAASQAAEVADADAAENETGTLSSSRPPQQYLILLRDHESAKFKGLYSYNPVLEQILKVYGVGPCELDSKMITHFYKYNSGGRHLQGMSSKSLSPQVDAITIEESCWTKRNAPAASTRRNRASAVGGD